MQLCLSFLEIIPLTSFLEQEMQQRYWHWYMKGGMWMQETDIQEQPCTLQLGLVRSFLKPYANPFLMACTYITVSDLLTLGTHHGLSCSATMSVQCCKSQTWCPGKSCGSPSYIQSKSWGNSNGWHECLAFCSSERAYRNKQSTPTEWYHPFESDIILTSAQCILDGAGLAYHAIQINSRWISLRSGWVLDSHLLPESLLLWELPRTEGQVNSREIHHYLSTISCNVPSNGIHEKMFHLIEHFAIREWRWSNLALILNKIADKPLWACCRTFCEVKK